MLLQTAVTVLTFYGQTPDSLAGLLPRLWIALGVLVAAALLPAVACVIGRWHLKPLSHPRTDDDALVYHELIREHLPLLRMTWLEFASRTGLPFWDAIALLDDPSFVPRPDVEERVRRALMVPDGWSPGRGYGSACTIERLKWYTRKRIVAYAFLQELLACSPRRRATMLSRVEDHVRTFFLNGRTP